MTSPAAGMATLRRLRERPAPQPERCALCGESLPGEHRHLADTTRRALACACTACSLLFTRDGAGGGRWKAVPDRVLSDPGHEIDEMAWQRLSIPVGVAFFLRNAEQDRLVALYPGPAGTTESELDPQTWESVLGGTRLADELAPDTEALLIRREDAGTACFLVPVDACYALAGRLRQCWRGFDGGAEAHAEIDAFFAGLAHRARTPRPARAPRTEANEEEGKGR